MKNYIKYLENHVRNWSLYTQCPSTVYIKTILEKRLNKKEIASITFGDVHEINAISKISMENY